MASNSWNLRNSWKWHKILRTFEIFEREKLFANFCIRRSRQEFFRNFSDFCQFLEMASNSWNFRNSWKWHKILGTFEILGNGVKFLGIFEILENDIKFLESSKFSNEKNFWPIFVSGEVDRNFSDFSQFLEMASNSWKFRNSRRKKIFGQFFYSVLKEHYSKRKVF